MRKHSAPALDDMLLIPARWATGGMSLTGNANEIPNATEASILDIGPPRATRLFGPDVHDVAPWREAAIASVNKLQQP